jgi:hypothetical protein
MNTSLRNLHPASIALALGLAAAIGAAPAAAVTGAIFTTDSLCNGTNVNIFLSTDDVYLDGGPAHPGAAGLPDGSYYVQVTQPNGTLLGTSVGSGNETPAVVSGGEFASCYQLSAILIKASDATAGYDSTLNRGGEYKVWISTEPTFTNSNTKTDNFKVKEDRGSPRAALHVRKFYDADADGIQDAGEVELTGWQVLVEDGFSLIRYTPVDLTVEPDLYTVTEFAAIQPNWVATTPNPASLTLANGADETVVFGNVCLGGGGGHTLGFWSNKNGQTQIGDGGTSAPELALLAGLSLKDAGGGDFDPADYSALRNWLLNGTAVNMAYMLSVQLSAMQLSVEAGFVDGSGLIYIPNVGFFSVSAVMGSANAALAADGYTPAGDPNRASQEILKNALDAANNNQNFVQATACPYSFAP